MIKEFLKKYNFFPNDLLGQNFLVNEIALQDIVDAAEIEPGDEVLEIGPGIGNLTKLIAEKAAYVLAVEKDPRYFPILKDQLGEKLIPHTRTPKSSASVEVIFDDVTKYNFQEKLAPGYKVVANIPYYITGKIIEMLLKAEKRPSKIAILVQKEVAQRVTAEAGELSILAISVQLYSKARIALHVPKEDFYPMPKVDSALLILDVLDKPLYDVDEKKFFRIIKASFAGKRKQIHNTLKNNLGLDEKRVQEVLAATKIDPKSRPQELTLEQWFELYKILEKHP